MIPARRYVIGGLFGLPFLAGAPRAYAHREKITTTNIKWNNDTQTLDITHIFHIHHAESALEKIGVIPKNNLRDLRNQARLAIYVEDNFSLSDDTGNAIVLATLGAEASGKNAYVYQEAKAVSKPTTLKVNCSLLRPPIAEQINHIDLDLDGIISSIRLTGRQTQKNLVAK